MMMTSSRIQITKRMTWGKKIKMWTRRMPKHITTQMILIMKMAKKHMAMITTRTMIIVFISHGRRLYLILSNLLDKQLERRGAIHLAGKYQNMDTFFCSILRTVHQLIQTLEQTPLFSVEVRVINFFSLFQFFICLIYFQEPWV